MSDTEQIVGWAGVVRAPQLSVLPGIVHGFSTRFSGVSTVYNPESRGELNLGWTPDDDPASVAENRRRLVREVAPGARLITIRQVHAATNQLLGENELATPLETPEGRAVLEGDGLITDHSGILLGIQTADCVPVLVADAHRGVVAAFHAGWRGTVQRIVESGVQTMQEQYGSRPEDLVAVVGPAIGACCYAVGEELRTAFETGFDYASSLFTERPEADGVTRMYLDLAEANRRQLLAAGVPPGSVTLLGECTACAEEKGQRRYFSHRAERGHAGRMMSVIGLQR